MEEEITPNSIRLLFGHDSSKNKIIKVNYVLQILNIKEKIVKDKDVYQLTLSDSTYFYDHFFVEKNILKDAKISDLFKIISIYPIVSLENLKAKSFIISSLKKIKNLNYIVGQPIQYLEGYSNLTQVEGPSKFVHKNLDFSYPAEKDEINLTKSEVKNNKILLDLNTNVINDSKFTSPNKYQFKIFDEFSQRSSSDKKKLKPPQNLDQNFKVLRLNKFSQGDSSNDTKKVKNFYFPIKKLSGLVTEFSIQIRVVDIQKTKWGTIYVTVKDKENSYADITINKKNFTKYDLFKLDKVYRVSNGTVKNYLTSEHSLKFGNIIKSKITSYDQTIIEELEDENEIKSNLFDNLVSFEKIQYSYINNKFNLDVLVYVHSINNSLFSKSYILSASDISNYKLQIIVDYFKFKDFSNKFVEGKFIYLSNLLIKFEDSSFILVSTNNTCIENFSERNSQQVKDLKILCENTNKFQDAVLHRDVFKDRRELKIFRVDNIESIIEFSKCYDINCFLNKYKTVPVMRVIRVTIVNLIHNNFVYLGCPICHRIGQGVCEIEVSYICQECKIEVESKAFYCIKLAGRDCSGEISLTLFGELGDKLFNMTAEDYFNTLKLVDKTKISALNEKIEHRKFFFVVKIDYRTDIKFMSSVVVDFWRELEFNSHVVSTLKSYLKV